MYQWDTAVPPARWVIISSETCDHVDCECPEPGRDGAFPFEEVEVACELVLISED